MYMIKAAILFGMKSGGDFSWYWNEERHTLDRCEISSQIGVANMLWQENIKSVRARYPDADYANLPGEVGETYVIDERDCQMMWPIYEPTQVIKCCNCYSYQSCEHDGWMASEAHAFIEHLIHLAITALPKYESAEWGAPAPLHKIGRG
ncbi:MAG: hypothetical protein PHO67_07915 [Candidatus Omnitrophica bacterium]|nr:hypothetical protein [Candidatus Omnitrophota bacterium]